MSKERRRFDPSPLRWPQSTNERFEATWNTLSNTATPSASANSISQDNRWLRQRARASSATFQSLDGSGAEPHCNRTGRSSFETAPSRLADGFETCLALDRASNLNERAAAATRPLTTSQDAHCFRTSVFADLPSGASHTTNLDTMESSAPVRV
jgi:hypothetical protein